MIKVNICVYSVFYPNTGFDVATPFFPQWYFFSWRISACDRQFLNNPPSKWCNVCSRWNAWMFLPSPHPTTGVDNLLQGLVNSGIKVTVDLFMFKILFCIETLLILSRFFWCKCVDFLYLTFHLNFNRFIIMSIYLFVIINPSVIVQKNNFSRHCGPIPFLIPIYLGGAGGPGRPYRGDGPRGVLPWDAGGPAPHDDRPQGAGRPGERPANRCVAVWPFRPSLSWKGYVESAEIGGSTSGGKCVLLTIHNPNTCSRPSQHLHKKTPFHATRAY